MSSFNDELIALEGRVRERGLSVDEFCKSAGINRATWTRWKSGKSSPQMRKWRAVCDALDGARPAGPSVDEAAAA
ncbi:MAG: helix-turn-helix domain-containing protein [Alphaproteobacteria bacterium]